MKEQVALSSRSVYWYHVAPPEVAYTIDYFRLPIGSCIIGLNFNGVLLFETCCIFAKEDIVLPHFCRSYRERPKC